MTIGPRVASLRTERVCGALGLQNSEIFWSDACRRGTNRQDSPLPWFRASQSHSNFQRPAHSLLWLHVSAESKISNQLYLTSKSTSLQPSVRSNISWIQHQQLCRRLRRCSRCPIWWHRRQVAELGLCSHSCKKSLSPSRNINTWRNEFQMHSNLWLETMRARERIRIIGNASAYNPVRRGRGTYTPSRIMRWTKHYYILYIYCDFSISWYIWCL